MEPLSSCTGEYFQSKSGERSRHGLLSKGKALSFDPLIMAGDAFDYGEGWVQGGVWKCCEKTELPNRGRTSILPGPLILLINYPIATHRVHSTGWCTIAGGHTHESVTSSGVYCEKRSCTVHAPVLAALSGSNDLLYRSPRNHALQHPGWGHPRGHQQYRP